MQFRISVRRDDEGWQVEVLDSVTDEPMLYTGTDKLLLEQPRRLRSIASIHDQEDVFPLPPLDEVNSMPTDAPHYQLCTAEDTAILEATFAGIIRREPGVDGMERFGRYLFTTLLGDKLWHRLKATAGDNSIELALCWERAQRALHRLPWEAMHGPDLFLVQEPRVAITRRVTDAQLPTEVVIERPPRVLFIVGADLNSDLIRHGAGYVDFLWRMRRTHLDLHHHMLYQPAPDVVSAIVESFQPAVVYFICPVNLVNGEWKLRLMGQDSSVAVGATDLLTILTPNALPTPPILVLSACHSLTEAEARLQSVGQCTTQLAVDLIQGGVPIVLSLAGTKTDDACRRLIWRFFDALLTDETIDLANAAAIGRRAGLPRAEMERLTAPVVHIKRPPWTTVDWALPMLFMADGVAKLRSGISPSEQQRGWHSIADRHFPSEEFPALCGRMELFAAYDLLMADTSFQRVVLNRRELQVLAISAGDDAAADRQQGRRPQYGRTRLLDEFAAEATRDGHIPLLLTEKNLKTASLTWPTQPVELIEALIKVAATTARYFVPAGATLPILRELGRMEKQNDGTLPPQLAQIPDINNAYNNDPLDPDLLAIAFHLDLLDYIRQLRKTSSSTSAVEDQFSLFEKSLVEFRLRLQPTDPLLLAFDNYRMQLVQNISDARRNNDTPQLSNDRNRILGELNRLALEKWSISFDGLAGIAPTGASSGDAQRDNVKLLLLIDDVHRMGDAVSLLLSNLLSPVNLDAMREDVRIILTYSTAKEDSIPVIVERIFDWIGGDGRIEPRALGKFRNPVEARLAYEHFLLYWKDKDEWFHLTPKTENNQVVQYFFERLANEVNGIPSYLKSEGASSVIRTFIDKENTPPPLVALRRVDDQRAFSDIE